MQNLVGKSSSSALVLGLGAKNISGSKRKYCYESSDPDDEEYDAEQYTTSSSRFIHLPKLVTSEHHPVLVFSYNSIDASDPHDRICVAISLPVGFEGMTYSVTRGGMALELKYYWPRNLTQEMTIFPNLDDKNSPERVGLRQAIKKLSSDDQSTSILATLPFSADINDITHRITGDAGVPPTTLIMTLRRQGAEGIKHSIGKV